jgi:hypothetical protein
MKLPEFNSEQEVINFARVNGFDEGGINKLINEWREANLARDKGEPEEVDES